MNSSTSSYNESYNQQCSSGTHLQTRSPTALRPSSFQPIFWGLIWYLHNHFHHLTATQKTQYYFSLFWMSPSYQACYQLKLTDLWPHISCSRPIWEAVFSWYCHVSAFWNLLRNSASPFRFPLRDSSLVISTAHNMHPLFWRTGRLFGYFGDLCHLCCCKMLVSLVNCLVAVVRRWFALIRRCWCDLSLLLASFWRRVLLRRTVGLACRLSQSGIVCERCRRRGSRLDVVESWDLVALQPAFI